MKLYPLLLLVGTLGCNKSTPTVTASAPKSSEPRTNWDYVSTHTCAYAAHFGDEFSVYGGVRSQTGVSRTVYRCDPDDQWVEVNDSDIPSADRGGVPIVQIATPGDICTNIVAAGGVTVTCKGAKP